MDKKPAEAKPEKPPPPINAPDLKLLSAMVGRLVVYLADFDSLGAALKARATRAPAGAAANEMPLDLLSSIVIEGGRLIEDAGVGCYRFVLDETGRGPGMAPPAETTAKGETAKRDTTEAATPPDGKRPAPRRRTRAARTPPAPGPAAEGEAAATPPDSPDLLEAIAGLVTATGISLSDLVGCGLLPPSVGDRTFETILADRRLVEIDPTQVDARRRAEDGERGLQLAFDSQGPNLTRALMILMRVVRDTGVARPPAQILRSISRYLTPGSEILLPTGLEALVKGASLSGRPETIRAFSRAYQEAWNEPSSNAPPPDMSDELLRDAWLSWQEQIVDFLRRGKAFFTATVHYPDILMAAKGVAPGRLFRASLKDMDQLDWSQAAFAALPSDSGRVEAPYWLLFAALTALRFDRGDLVRLNRSPAPPSMPADAILDRSGVDNILDRAETGRPRGILHAFPDGSPPREIPELKPMFSVGESAGPDYVLSLGWLAENELFDEGRDETE